MSLNKIIRNHKIQSKIIFYTRLFVTIIMVIHRLYCSSPRDLPHTLTALKVGPPANDDRACIRTVIKQSSVAFLRQRLRDASQHKEFFSIESVTSQRLPALSQSVQVVTKVESLVESVKDNIDWEDVAWKEECRWDDACGRPFRLKYCSRDYNDPRVLKFVEVIPGYLEHFRGFIALESDKAVKQSNDVEAQEILCKYGIYGVYVLWRQRNNGKVILPGSVEVGLEQLFKHYNLNMNAKSCAISDQLKNDKLKKLDTMSNVWIVYAYELDIE